MTGGGGVFARGGGVFARGGGVFARGGGSTERGAATIVALAIVSLLVLVAAGMVAAGRLVAAHTQATAAADAAALAAAPLTFLPGDPRSEAASYARHNGASLVGCACSRNPRFVPRAVTVEVAMPVDLPVFGVVTVRARAAAEFNPFDLLG